MPSIPTLGSLNVPVSNAVVETLRDLAKELDAKSGSIIGRGADVMEQMNSTAVEFTELVSEPLRRMGTESIEAARKAMEGSVWGSTVTGRWADDAEAYQKIAEQYSGLWAEQVANGFGVTAESAGVTGGMPSDVASKVMDNAMAEAGAGSLAMFQTVIDKAYEQYKADAKSAGTMLKGGPTPANLKALAGGGGTSWTMFNMFGAAAGVPPLTGKEGKAFAEWLRAFLPTGDALPADARKMFEAFLALANDAEGKQANGGKLTADQLDFLEEFYKSMDAPMVEGGPIKTEVLYNLAEILKGSDVAAGDQSTILAAVGGGLMALSDPKLGGGTQRLPQSMQQLVNHYFGKDKPPFDEAQSSRLNGLGQLLGAAKAEGLDKLKANRELSAAMTLAVADSNKFASTVDNDSLQHILEYSLRNKDANAALLLGDLTHPEFGKHTPEHVLRGVFGPNWSDDGAAASRLIDWIADDVGSGNKALADRATEAAFVVFTTMTDRGEPNHWSWRESAYDFFTDHYGSPGGFQDAPIGQGNPAVSLAMAKTGAAFFDVLNAPDIEADSKLQFTNQPGEPDMYLSMQTRKDFVEMIMGGDASRDAFGKEAYKYVLAHAAFADEWKNDEEAYEEAMKGGALMGLLDHGLQQVIDEAQMDADAETTQATQHANWARAGAAAVKEVVTELPMVRGLGRGWQQLIRQSAESFKWSPGVAQSHDFFWSKGVTPEIKNYEGDAGYEAFGFGATYAVAEQLLKDTNSGLTVEDIRQSHPQLVEKGANGDWQLKSSEDLMKDTRYTYREATRDLQSMFDKDLDGKLDHYIQNSDHQRKG